MKTDIAKGVIANDRIEGDFLYSGSSFHDATDQVMFEGLRVRFDQVKVGDVWAIADEKYVNAGGEMITRLVEIKERIPLRSMRLRVIAAIVVE